MLDFILFCVNMKQCQSCGMPLTKDPSGQGWGTERDWSISMQWCSLCYKNGHFVWGEKTTLAQMQKIVDDAMKAQWFGRWMRTMVKLQMPHLERWKSSSYSSSSIWFVRKSYGRGWTPATRQGRLITLWYVAGVVVLIFCYGGTEQVPPTEEMRTKLVIGMGVATLLLLLICYRKGESPRWQWGTRK